MDKKEEIIRFVRSRFPDAHCFKWATLSIYIRSTLCGRISGIFRTEEEAWLSAVEWIEKKDKGSFAKAIEFWSKYEMTESFVETGLPYGYAGATFELKKEKPTEDIPHEELNSENKFPQPDNNDLRQVFPDNENMR